MARQRYRTPPSGSRAMVISGVIEGLEGTIVTVPRSWALVRENHTLFMVRKTDLRWKGRDGKDVYGDVER